MRVQVSEANTHMYVRTRSHGRFAARVLEHLRRNNQSPWAALEIEQVFPGRVDVHALDSMDPDGHVKLYDFWLEAEDGEVLAGPITTRNPGASLMVHPNRELGPNLRAVVVVEDNLGAIDQAAVSVPADVNPSCSNSTFTCNFDSSTSRTTCVMASTAGDDAFSMSTLLSAASGCDSSLSNNTKLMIHASGAWGSRGANVGLTDGGGAGGSAAMGTTIADLNSTYGASTTWAYGMASAGTHSNTHSGGGGAATLLRAANVANQFNTDGVLLIGPGGGGGGAANGFDGGNGGGVGGIAISSTLGSCPGAFCLEGSTVGDTSIAGCTGGSGIAGGGSGGGAPGLCGDNGATSNCQGAGGPGGAGGEADGAAIAYWFQGNPLVIATGEVNNFHAGQGGPVPPFGDSCHGGGGGGWGGGNGGDQAEAGGGGGGAYAAPSSWDITDPPGFHNGVGYIWFVFIPD